MKETNDVEFYINKFGDEKAERLFKIRAAGFSQFPTAAERIYYGIPTMEVGRQIVLQYAGYKNHVSMLLGNALPAILKKKYPQYDYTEYTVVFADNRPFPEDFVKEVCRMVEQNILGNT